MATLPCHNHVIYIRYNRGHVNWVCKDDTIHVYGYGIVLDRSHDMLVLKS